MRIALRVAFVRTAIGLLALALLTVACSPREALETLRDMRTVTGSRTGVILRIQPTISVSVDPGRFDDAFWRLTVLGVGWESQQTVRLALEHQNGTLTEIATVRPNAGGVFVVTANHRTVEPNAYAVTARGGHGRYVTTPLVEAPGDDSW